MGRHQTSRQRPQWPELTGEDELLLHHVDVPAGPPDGGAQHDLLGVVAAHAAGAVPAGGRSQVREELQFLTLTQSGRRGRDFPTSRGESDCMWKSGKPNSKPCCSLRLTGSQYYLCDVRVGVNE